MIRKPRTFSISCCYSCPLAPGLDPKAPVPPPKKRGNNLVDRLLSEAKAKLETQGAMELASALSNFQGFVPYWAGQNTPSTDLAKEQSKAPDTAQQQIERGGREV